MKTVGKLVSFLFLASVCTQPVLAEDSWTQWGGDNQDFKTSSSGLKSTWGEDGPAKLWSRDLGDGYSAILAENGRLYTMYRSDDQESVICLNAKDGSTVWEHRYASGPEEGHVAQFGTGPRATPLIVGDQIFTIGISGVMLSLDKATGKVKWKHDLWKEYGGNFLNHGYSSSPIPYQDTIIVLVGGEGQSIVAFEQKNGAVKWQTESFANSYSTPQIYELGGEPHLITFMAQQVVGLNPANGKLAWSYDIRNQWEQNINTPTLIDNEYLFFSSLQAGARGVKLSREEGKVKAEELWSTRKIQFYHVNSVVEGDTIYGSTGGQVSFMASVNIKTGKINWRKRGFAKANVVQADGKLYILDENGVLYLTTATPEDLVVHSKAQILDNPAWTAPTIVDKTMYIRDKKSILALNLG